MSVPRTALHRVSPGLLRVRLALRLISYADLSQVEYLEHGQTVDLMRNGQLDAAIISAGIGVAAVQREMSQGPIFLIPVEKLLITKTHSPRRTP